MNQKKSGLKTAVVMLFYTICFTINIFPQTDASEEQFNRINEKIFAEFEKQDGNCLDLNYIILGKKDSRKSGLILDSLRKADGTFSRFVMQDATSKKSYYIYFIRNGLGLEEITPVMIALSETPVLPKTANTLNDRGGSKKPAAEDPSQSVKFDIRDFVSLKYNYPNEYREFCRFINRYKNSEKKLRASDTEKYLETFSDANEPQLSLNYGIVSRNNDDLIRYMKINSPRKFPDIENTSENPDSSYEGEQEGSSSSGFFALKYCDISLSQQCIGLNGLNVFLPEGLGGVGLVNRFEDKSINYLPFESPYLSPGLSLFLKLTDRPEELRESFFTELNVLGRIPYNSSKLLRYAPIFGVQNPKVNVTPGIIIDAHLSKNLIKPFFTNFPFVNVFISTGSENYSKPQTYYSSSSTMKSAYFLTSSWMLSLSFYWNSDVEKRGIYRLDIGIGGSKVRKVDYFLDSTEVSIEESITQPYVSMEYDLIPKKKPILGIKAGLYDNRMRCDFWMKLFEIAQSVDVRFECQYVGKTILRNLRDWESPGGFFTQLRFRYGFTLD